MKIKTLQKNTWYAEKIINVYKNTDTSLPFKYCADIKEGENNKTFKTYFNTAKDLNIQFFNN